LRILRFLQKPGILFLNAFEVTMSQDDLYTPEEAARVLRVSVDTIYRMIKGGQLEAVRIRGQWRIKRASVDKLLGKQP
jgi:excisionase family DNA binding protein